ncbi:hypothetical protein HK098_002062 [Nowakowskiella sp. JEL0407]|nr:hypothetical protein HK098_002062 [Nowakowskiella sp. JEL0407]
MSSTTATQVTFGYKDPTAISQQLQQQQPLKSSFKSPSSYSLGNPGNVGVTSPSPNLMKHVRNASISASQNPHKLQGSRSTTPLVPTTDIPPSPNANPQNRKSVATTTFASEYVINLDRKSQYFPQLEKPAEK